MTCYENSLKSPAFQDQIDKQQVVEAAKAQAEDLFTELLGDPTSRQGDRWRWGKNGSFSASVTGSKAGAWIDFESNEKGDLLEFWAQRVLGMSSASDDFPRVLKDLAGRVGVRGEITQDQRKALDLKASQRAAEAQREAETKAESVKSVIASLQGSAQMIEGTPAQAYLQGRGLKAIPDPSAAQFIPANRPAQAIPYQNKDSLVVWARDPAGSISGGQRVILNQDGSRARSIDGEKLPKFTFGKIGGCAVVIPADPARAMPSASGLKAMFVCEGPETAFTIAESTGCEVRAALGVGNFAALDMPTDRPLVFCPDQDAEDSPAAESFNQAIEAISGLNVWVVRAPEPLGSKADLNDTLQRAGMDAVTAAISAAQPFGDPSAQSGPKPYVGRTVPPQCEPATLSADDVGRAVRGVVDSFLSSANGGDQWLVKASLGSGKSRAMIQAVANHLRSDSESRILIRVPTHKLAGETEVALTNLGVSVGVWRGTDAPDPAQREGVTMCRRAGDDLKAVRAAGGSHTALCGKASSEQDDQADRPSACGLCPFNPVPENLTDDWCGYKKQNLREKSVVIVCHDVSLTNRLPIKIRRPDIKGEDGKRVKDPRPDFDKVILDETSVTDLLSGSDGKAGVALGALRCDLDAMASDAGHDLDKLQSAADNEADRVARARATATRLALAEVLDRAASEGNLITVDLFRRAGVVLSDLENLSKAIWNWRPSVSGADGLQELDAEAIKEALGDKAALSFVVGRVSSLCKAVLQGWLDAEIAGDYSQPFAQVKFRRAHGEAGPYQVAELITRAEIAEDVLACPILILDATPQFDLLRKWFPSLEMKGDFRAKDGEGVFRVQLIDSHMSYGAISPNPRSKDYHRQKRNSWRALVIARLFSEALGGKAGLILPMASEDYLKTQAASVASDVTLGHFGAVRGSNAFEDSRVLVTAGRQAPRVEVAERLAAVIAGKPIQPITPDEQGRAMFAQRKAALSMRDGSGLGVINESHPDQIVDAVRRTVTEDELDQAQGRGRSARRGADLPLLDVRISDVASDQPVDVTWRRADFKSLGGYAGVMLGAGVWPIGTGRARLIQKALAAHIRGHGVDVTDLPDRWLARLLVADDREAADMLRNAVCDYPNLGDLIKTLDSGLGKEAPFELCGVPVHMDDWHQFRAATEGRYSGSVMLRGASVSEAAEHGAALFGEEYTLTPEQTDQAIRPSAAQLAQERFTKAIADHGMILKSPRAAERFMPEIWFNHTLAKVDLEMDSLLEGLTPKCAGLPNRAIYGNPAHLGTSPSNKESHPIEARTNAKYCFDVMFKPRSCQQWKRTRHTAALIFADSKREAKQKAEALVLRLLGDALGEGFKMHPLESFEIIDVIGLHTDLDLAERVALGGYDYISATKKLIRLQAGLAHRSANLFKPPDKMSHLFFTLATIPSVPVEVAEMA